MMPAMDFDRLPGGIVIRQGLDDLVKARETEASLLVLVGSPRLRRLGLPIPQGSPSGAEHRLYEHLSRTGPNRAHSRYNALIRLLVSFERAAECVG